MSGFPAQLQATNCVVLHIAPNTRSLLARILDRAGPLPCRPASDVAIVDGEAPAGPSTAGRQFEARELADRGPV